LKNGFNLGNEDVVIKLMKGNTTLYFDRILKIKNGFVSEIKLLPIRVDMATIVFDSRGMKKNIDIYNLHTILVHCGEATAKMTGKAKGYDVVGVFKPCEACSVGKARQKNINKEWKGSSMTAGERLYVDISSVKGEIYGRERFTNPFCFIHRSKFCFKICHFSCSGFNDTTKFRSTN
jgi:hypothetical protein